MDEKFRSLQYSIGGLLWKNRRLADYPAIAGLLY